jgi:hypothetical protein
LLSVGVNVTGLTEKEMPGKDFVHMQIPVLCIGGGGVSIASSQQVGHLFLMRNTEGAKKARFRYYQEHILIPGINLQHKKHCNYDIAAGTTIPDAGIRETIWDASSTPLKSLRQGLIHLPSLQ